MQPTCSGQLRAVIEPKMVKCRLDIGAIMSDVTIYHNPH